MQTKVQLLNNSQEWDAKKRYKVNEVVLFEGFSYQNTTGGNSSPSDLTDWILLNESENLTAGEGIDITDDGEFIFAFKGKKVEKIKVNN